MGGGVLSWVHTSPHLDGLGLLALLRCGWYSSFLCSHCPNDPLAVPMIPVTKQLEEDVAIWSLFQPHEPHQAPLTLVTRRPAAWRPEITPSTPRRNADARTHP
ncbi:hypothetical protein VTJ04DRAFT_8977 [Mycothermus thermophilus]|uniref:uncharacterized protein n=1 Tax=Humicola insolens TaxID=85995 RepID=UPI0037438EEE